MVKIEHTPKENFINHYTITGNDIDEILNFCKPKIRGQSQLFYIGCIEKNLKMINNSEIDQHAGMGYFYKIYLVNKDFIYCQSQIELGKKCEIQCQHCKKYYKPL